MNEPSKHSLNGNKKKFFYSACNIKQHIIIIKLIGKIFNLTTCSPELITFAVVLSIVVPIPGTIVVVVVVAAIGTCVVVVVSATVVVVVGSSVVVVVVGSSVVVVVVGSSVVVVEAEDILNLN